MSSHAEYRKKGGNGLAYNMPKPVPSPAPYDLTQTMCHRSSPRNFCAAVIAILAPPAVGLSASNLIVREGQAFDDPGVMFNREIGAFPPPSTIVQVSPSNEKDRCCGVFGTTAAGTGAGAAGVVVARSAGAGATGAGATGSARVGAVAEGDIFWPASPITVVAFFSTLLSTTPEKITTSAKKATM